MQLHKFAVRLSSAALLLLAAAAPVAAAEPMTANEASVADGNGPPAHATKPSANEPKKICRDIATTSSRLKTTRVCLTREQWRRAKYN